jgi:sulfur-oxidizing protein SoxZ
VAAKARSEQEKAMASTIRVRAIARDDITEVQTLIQHPMDSGLAKDAQGQLIAAHFIRQLTFAHNGKIVFAADWGPAVAKDPYVKFAFKGAAKGDELKIGWIDNKGGSDSTTAKIQ